MIFIMQFVFLRIGKILFILQKTFLWSDSWTSTFWDHMLQLTYAILLIKCVSGFLSYLKFMIMLNPSGYYELSRTVVFSASLASLIFHRSRSLQTFFLKPRGLHARTTDVKTLADCHSQALLASQKPTANRWSVRNDQKERLKRTTGIDSCLPPMFTMLPS